MNMSHFDLSSSFYIAANFTPGGALGFTLNSALFSDILSVVVYAIRNGFPSTIYALFYG